MQTIKRGDIVRVRLDPTEGSEQAGERPALVVSADLLNEHSPVLIIAPITSKKTERVFRFEALIEPPEGGLNMRSKVLLPQLRSLDKRRIIDVYGSVSSETMRKVDEALKIAVGLVRL
jgi:mRNA interferase MazF